MPSVTPRFDAEDGHSAYSIGPPPGAYSVAGRGTLTEAEALSRWPLAARVYAEMEVVLPCSPAFLADRLGLPEDDVRQAMWWLRFADDNGYDQMVCLHWAISDESERHFCHRRDRPNGCAEASAVSELWLVWLDRVAARREERR